MPKRKAGRSLGVFADLVNAVDWYDVSLQRILSSRGMTSVNRTQSVMLIHIAEGITKPSDIAFEMGTTRQNIHAMAKGLVAENIIEIAPDPTDGRAKQYAFSEKSAELRDTVIKILRFLDRKLVDRIGAGNVKALREALSTDWGDVVDEYPEPRRR